MSPCCLFNVLPPIVTASLGNAFPHTRYRPIALMALTAIPHIRPPAPKPCYDVGISDLDDWIQRYACWLTSSRYLQASRFHVIGDSCRQLQTRGTPCGNMVTPCHSAHCHSAPPEGPDPRALRPVLIKKSARISGRLLFVLCRYLGSK